MSQTAFAERVRQGQQAMRDTFARHDRGEEVDWEALRGLPGVRLEPISWEELAVVVADGGEDALGSLGRSPLAIKDYWLNNEQVSRWCSWWIAQAQSINFAKPAVPNDLSCG